MLLVLKTREIPRFAESVDLNQLHLRQKVSSSTDQLRGHRRSAVCQYFETAQITVLRLRELRQQVDHRRDQNGVVDLVLLDRLTESGRSEARKRDLAPSEYRRREHRGKIGDVENR